MSELNHDQLFEAVRDGSFTEAKQALSKLDVSWRHSQLQQKVLFLIPARQRRGSEILGRRAVRMGFDLAEVDVILQTPLFYAAAYGTLTIVKLVLNLGFQVNWRDSWRETALCY